MKPARQTAGAIVLFAALTVVMTWPQTARLATAAPEHQDVYFNIWRLEWFAHALEASPLRVFDGNIFYPERRALTFSDAMPVEGTVAAPLVWAGVRPVLVHNILLLGAIVSSALGMFVLARRVTGSASAAVAAGIVFAFAPYRFSHYMHMELQWAMWIPWTFWALDRTIASGRIRDGIATGVFVALQTLSSIYYGVFLATLLAAGAFLFLLTLRGARLFRVTAALAAGGLVAVMLVAIYAAPYVATRERVGGRGEEEVIRFSARISSYAAVTPDNLLYGDRHEERGRDERRLFPGFAVVLLAMAGLLLRPPSARIIVYMLLMVIAFEMSLGLSGYSYRLLYMYVPVFSGFRAVARLGIFVLFFLGLLGASAIATLQQALPRMTRPILAVAVCCTMLLEYWVAPLQLVRYPNAAPPLYRFVAALPPGVVAEFPMPSEDGQTFVEPWYIYMSTFHWKPIVNGYSGYAPPSYLSRLRNVSGFPDDRSIERLRSDGVRYVLYHPGFYPPEEAERLLLELERRPDLTLLGRFNDGVTDAYAFSLR